MSKAIENATGISFDAKNKNGDTLVGVAARFKDAGFVKLNIYAVAFYVDEKAAEKALGKYGGQKAEDLAKDQKFFRDIVAADFRRSFSAVFHRDLEGDLLQGMIDRALKSRVDDESAIEEFKGAFPGGLAKGDTVTVDINKAKVTVTVNGGKKDIKSQSLANGLQNAYFDDKCLNLELRAKLVEDFADVLGGPAPFTVLRSQTEFQVGGPKPRSGYLFKYVPANQRQGKSGWKRRWFDLRQTFVVFKKEPQDENERGFIDLKSSRIEFEGIQETANGTFASLVIKSTTPTGERWYRLSETPAVLESWHQALLESVRYAKGDWNDESEMQPTPAPADSDSPNPREDPLGFFKHQYETEPKNVVIAGAVAVLAVIVLFY